MASPTRRSSQPRRRSEFRYSGERFPKAPPHSRPRAIDRFPHRRAPLTEAGIVSYSPELLSRPNGYGEILVAGLVEDALVVQEPEVASLNPDAELIALCREFIDLEQRREEAVAALEDTALDDAIDPI